MKSTIMIAATGSGKGKTTFVTGLLKALKENNNDMSVHAFKCGPDYIDPMFHKEVLGIPSTNIDPFFCDNDLLLKVFSNNAGDINVIEAAMGLYDGIGVSSRASAMETARILKCKVVLVVDGSGMGYSIVPMIKGYLSMDSDKLISGVVINRISEKYYYRIAPVIESETGIKVFGFIPKIKGAELNSRHLGLMSPEESDFNNKLALIAEQINKSVDIENILKSGEDSLCNNFIKENSDLNNGYSFNDRKELAGKKILVARDEAFSFIYEENIKFLERQGADIEYFSPIHDAKLSDDADAVIFYGGYPENYARELAENKSMIESVRLAASDKVKIIAECGGFMYLLNSIEVEGKTYDMAGIINGHAYRTSGLVRFGYVNIYDISERTCKPMKAHEFHHYDSKDVVYSDVYTIKNEASGDEYKGFVKTDNVFAGFPHLYYLSCPEFVIKLLK